MAVHVRKNLSLMHLSPPFLGQCFVATRTFLAKSLWPILYQMPWLLVLSHFLMVGASCSMPKIGQALSASLSIASMAHRHPAKMLPIPATISRLSSIRQGEKSKSPAILSGNQLNLDQEIETLERRPTRRPGWCGNQLNLDQEIETQAIVEPRARRVRRQSIESRSGD